MMRGGERPESLEPVNVLAGLAERVVQAVLERGEDERDPFADALERYRSAGVPAEADAPWRGGRGLPGPAVRRVLRTLGRDLLAGVVSYATTSASKEEAPAEAEEVEDAPRLAVVGAGRTMPSLELAPDGTWHVAAPAEAPGTTAGGRPHAAVPTLASRYPRP